jgi:hypothetical protein
VLALLLSACVDSPTVEQSAEETPVTSDTTPERLTPLSDAVEDFATSAADPADTPAAGVDGDLPDEEDPIVTAYEVDYNTDEYLMKTVAVEGVVNERLGERAFWLADPTPLTGEVLVIETGGLTESAAVGESVIVEGEVRRFDPDEIAGETGYDLFTDVFTSLEQDERGFDLFNSLLDQIDQRSVILASSIAAAPDTSQ